ncbi:MAG: hypothetical protein WB698_11010 [Solirubrobacteraceae bacterium]
MSPLGTSRQGVMVFFDEFQEVAGRQHPYGDPDRLTKRMRAIFQRSGGVSYLFAARLERMMRCCGCTWRIQGFWRVGQGMRLG